MNNNNKVFCVCVTTLLVSCLMACGNNSVDVGSKNIDTLKNRAKTVKTQANKIDSEIDLDELSQIPANPLDYKSVTHKFLDEKGETDTVFLRKE